MAGLFLEPSSVRLPILINKALANQIYFQARKQYGKTHIVSVMQYFMSEV